jgi:hypothetical protein
MAPPRKLSDDERSDADELVEINLQLDSWKIPTRSHIGGGAPKLTTLGRVRIMRNQCITVVAALRGENARLKRLLEAETGEKIA